VSFNGIEIAFRSYSFNRRDVSDEVHGPALRTYKTAGFGKNTISIRTRGVSQD